MNIKDFLSNTYDINLDNIIDNNDLWNTKEIYNSDNCIVNEIDASFYDTEQRVKKKYLNIPEFMEYYNKTMEELSQITNPPLKSRDILLGTTEYLFPYVAYCIKYIENNCNISCTDEDKEKLPFIFYAAKNWSEENNINTLDCISAFYTAGKYNKIIIFLPIDKSALYNPQGQPRITVKEIYRIYKNIGNVNITVETDVQKHKLIINIPPLTLGGKNRKQKKTKKNKKKQKKTKKKKKK
jgi:hypothetical protein